MRTRYRNVFSFRFLSLGFGMSSRDRSPNSLRSGLWSTATIRSLHPRTKYRALSSASATASASPSTGAYRDSALCVKRLPTRAIFQPVGQQNNYTLVQLQCFTPVSSETRWLGLIENLHSLFYFADDGFLGSSNRKSMCLSQ